MNQLIIDADMLVHPASQICRDEIDWPPTEDGEVPFTQVVVNLAEARGRILSQVTEWEIAFEAAPGTSILCFSHPDNFRKGVLPDYKGHREGAKPPGFHKLVEWCGRTWQCERWPGLEADDVCGILGGILTELWIDGAEPAPLLVSGDKDFQTIPVAQHDFNRDLPGDYRAPSLEEADRYHMLQTLCGDATDGYKGCPGVGPVKAEKILSEGSCLAEWWPLVVAAFEAKGLTEEEALVNARLAYILRDGDYFAPGVDGEGKPWRVRLWEPPVVEKAVAA